MNDVIATIGAAAILMHNECVLLVQQAQGKAKGNWILPGGLVQVDESLEEGVVREVFEETGAHIKIDSLCCVRYRKHERIFANVFWVFKGSFLSSPEDLKFQFSPDEIQAVRFWPLKEIQTSDVVRPATKMFISEHLERSEKKYMKRSYNFLGDKIYV